MQNRTQVAVAGERFIVSDDSHRGVNPDEGNVAGMSEQAVSWAGRQWSYRRRMQSQNLQSTTTTHRKSKRKSYQIKEAADFRLCYQYD